MIGLIRVGSLVCFAALLAAGESPATGDSAALTRARTALARMPLRFEANQGRMDPAIRYAARGLGYTLLLTGRGPALSFGDSKRVEIAMPGSNGAAQIEPLDPLSARTDSFIGTRANWRTQIPSYSRVRYRAVYPGIDLVYYGNQNQLEFDFVLAPGADPNAIRMQFRGASRLRLTAEGDLVIGSGRSQIVQKRPYIYQEEPGAGRKQISGDYVLTSRNTVRLRLADYDRTRPLVIDPVISYLTYMGGRGTDRVNAVKLGPDGRLYIAGQTDSSLMTATDGAFATANKGLTDVFLAILDTRPSGNSQLVYFSYLGGTNNDIPLGIDVDNQGFVYLTGTTASIDFPVAGTTLKTAGTTGTVDAFVTKIRPTDSGAEAVWYSTYLGGNTGNDSGNGIAVDASGVIYVIGTTQSSDFPVTSSTAYGPVLWEKQDAFVTKFDPSSGSLLYSTYLGGENLDEGRAIKVGSNGLVYFAASTLSQNFPWTGQAYATIPIGEQDIGVGIIDTNKAGGESVVYSSYFGGSGSDEVRGLSLDVQGNVILTGYTLSTDFPATGDAFQPTNVGSGDAYVSVLDLRQPFGSSLLYSTYLGGSGGDVAFDAKSDSIGNIYVTGYTLSANFPTGGNPPQNVWGGGTNIFLTKLRRGSAGSAGLLFSTYVGETGTYVGSSLAVGADGSMYVAGYGNAGLPLTEQHIRGFEGGQSDGFVFVIQQ